MDFQHGMTHRIKLFASVESWALQNWLIYRYVIAPNAEFYGYWYTKQVYCFYWNRASYHCTGYLVHPFLKMRGEQRFLDWLVCNFLKVYVSIFDLVQ